MHSDLIAAFERTLYHPPHADGAIDLANGTREPIRTESR
jgi:hypothetical protein